MSLEQAFNLQVANWSVLYTKLHNYHWFVTGPAFFELHEKFEELYDEAKATVDVAAERLLAIGGTPISSLKEFLEVTTLEEVNGKLSATEMVEELVADYKKIKADLAKLIELAEEANDDVSADYAIGLTEQIDLHIWMFTAYLAK